MTDPTNPLSFSRQFRPMGLAGETTSPMNVDEDSPPGAGGYASGPLANPRPSATPQPQSLSVMADGGTNHATAWMSGQQAPTTFQQAFPEKLSDLASSMNSPAPAQPVNPNDINHFSWSSAFQPNSGY